MNTFVQHSGISGKPRRISKSDPAHAFAISAIERFHLAVVAHGNLSFRGRKASTRSDRERLSLLTDLAVRQLEDAEAAVVHALLFNSRLITSPLDQDPSGFAYLLEEVGDPPCELEHDGRTYGVAAQGLAVRLTIDGEGFQLPE